MPESNGLSPETINERLNDENLKLAEALASLPTIEERLAALEAQPFPTQERLLQMMTDHWARTWNALVLGQKPELSAYLHQMILLELGRLNVISRQKFILVDAETRQEYTMEVSDAL